jgi:hypothetical protein
MLLPPPFKERLPGGGLRINLHAGQLKAHDSEARFPFITAGTQSGKTAYEPIWLAREIERKGPGDYYAVSATYDLLKLKLEQELIQHFVEELKWCTYKAAERVLVSLNGQLRIILRSADAAGGIESGTAKGAVFDECGHPRATREANEALMRRLSLAMGRCLYATTPYNLGWTKVDLYDRWLGGDPNYEVIQFESIMNPCFPREEFERARATLPLWKFQMFYQGLYAKPAGLIYGNYEDRYRELGGHLVKPFSVHSSWARYVGVDPGAVNCGRIWIAEDPASYDLYAYRTLLGGGKTAPEMAREAIEYKEPVRWWLGGAKSEDAQRLDWQLGGVPLARPLITNLEAGIDRVIGLFKQRRLYIFDSLHALRAELGSYSRELDDLGEPTEKIADKQKYHLLDALRYVCSGFTIDRPDLPEAEEEKPLTRSVSSITDFHAPEQEIETDNYH